jgi:hypothetical protein
MMRNTEECGSWVVYRMTLYRKLTQRYAVCEQSEWDTMQLSQPGSHTLVLAGIANEGEAERLARSCPVDDKAIKPSEVKA